MPFPPKQETSTGALVTHGTGVVALLDTPRLDSRPEFRVFGMDFRRRPPLLHLPTIAIVPGAQLVGGRSCTTTIIHPVTFTNWKRSPRVVQLQFGSQEKLSGLTTRPASRDTTCATPMARRARPASAPARRSESPGRPASPTIVAIHRQLRWTTNTAADDDDLPRRATTIAKTRSLDAFDEMPQQLNSGGGKS